MIEGAIAGIGGVKGLGADLPGQVHYGIQGPPGGHYIPNVKQVDSETAEISFSPSNLDMPPVDPVQIKLPIGECNGDHSGGNVENGEDGFSPIATVTQTDTGADISITDKDGTTTATITNGKDGEDGVSPTFMVMRNYYGNSTEIASTDLIVHMNGKEVAKVNIKNGTNGKTPVRGTDYWTPADQTAIVNEVLSALPTWTGGSY